MLALRRVGSRTRGMENSYSSAFYYEIPDVDIYENPLVGRGDEPAAPTEDLGTLESSSTMDMLFTKRDIPEALEEEEESEGPPGEQDLKETYIQLVQGVQEWQDGCVYRGDFGLDMKLGNGEFSWPTGESYRGQFYRDHRHGLGTYLWPDGSSFTGMFYLSYREGYGTMYQKTRLFQGLYKANERFGPGIETYPDGSQDVGLWFREHLIKLCTEVPSSFSIHDYPEYSGFLTHSPARISLLGEEKMEWDLHEEQDPFFYDYKRFLLNDDLTLPPEMYTYSTNNSHLPMTCSFRKELDALIFLNDVPPFVEDSEPWFIKNETPLMVKIQKQAYKYRNKKAHSSWNMGAILEGDRRSFACRGPKERLAKDMILRAGEGNYDWIYGILRDDLASADVADAKGYTVLAAAAVHCHNNIINLLLDHGADVNKYTDEGLTALNMCFLLYYPSRCFKPNIAERTVPKPQCARDIVRLLLSHKANPNMLWSGHSPLSLSIASGNDLIVKELLSHGADPNLPLTRGLGSALCVACDLTCEHQRSTDSKLALIDRLINYGADILSPVTLAQGDRMAVGTAVDYGYFKFYQDRKIAHCPFHMLMPAEREIFLGRKRLLEYVGFRLRRAVSAKESQWDPKLLNLSKK
ncbi:ankyrin repeat and MYND domain-containing protein 1, partial [Leptonychotes weddellii]|uniref:Ankyrin repeat and MYND domain-containing protein 1 n=1 Tax=Leptonychotes weddellii TaxID=9713 RepID=A0A2U3YSP7_LEPWE